FVKAGDMVSALGMHKKMLLHGCCPDVVTFTSLIDGYCRVGHVDYGFDLWNEMKTRNVSASLYTVSILISALCNSLYLQSGNVDEANATENQWLLDIASTVFA
ncbi:pentatricopeptide repeat-containing protein, partial [Trifolium medium]|nr:pentatricopeptide repeat-containing protein [Trifolium medium]